MHTGDNCDELDRSACLRSGCPRSRNRGNRDAQIVGVTLGEIPSEQIEPRSYPRGVPHAGVVGREAELATASSFLDSIAEHAHALVIEGDAGIGKTAVYRAVVDDAVTRGYIVLRCAGEEAEARLSFIGLTDLIGDVVDAFAAPLPPVQVEALDLALSRRRGDAGSTPDPKAAGIALRSLLANVAAHAPVLIAVDDVGWLDDSTLSSLAFVARRIEDLPIGLLTTLRMPAENIDPMGLDRALGSDRFHRISLGPLPIDPVVRIVEARFAGRFAQPVLRRIAAASGGNPLFALDIARSLDPSTPLEAGEPLPVPDSLHALVASRIASLSEQARTSLLAAAALFHPTAERRRTSVVRSGTRRGRGDASRPHRTRPCRVRPSALRVGRVPRCGDESSAGNASSARRTRHRWRGAGEAPGARCHGAGRSDRRRSHRGRSERSGARGVGLRRRTDGAGASLDARG